MNQQCTIGVDWGSTHRRSYVFDAGGKCTASHADDLGALACGGRFEAALRDLTATLAVKPARITLSGMVGSSLGWREVAYLTDSVPLWELRNHLALIDGYEQHTQVRIVPGYCVRDMEGMPDVMRGEETQLLGALLMGHHSGWFVLPGTHSKWVLLNRGRIVQLKTFMTGELFQLLSQHGSIASLCIKGANFEEAVFIEGIRASQQGALSNLLFRCRARVVCSDMPAAYTIDYLSGLLIGAELSVLASLKPMINFFHIIGEPRLAYRYELGAKVLALRCQSIDAVQSFCAAMGYFSIDERVNAS